jgi:type IV secretory pathway VirB10-like protein
MKKALKWVGIGFVGLIILGALLPSEDKDKAAPVPAQAEVQKPKAEKPEPKAEKPEPKAPAPKPEPQPEPPAQPAEPEMTSGQENAVKSAQSYLDMSGFSRKGLIQQLSSSAGEGFPKADATFAADHVDVNWKDEAVESAQGYLDMSSFSRDGLIEQLSSSAGEGFTLAQAQYAVGQVY